MTSHSGGRERAVQRRPRGLTDVGNGTGERDVVGEEAQDSRAVEDVVEARATALDVAGEKRRAGVPDDVAALVDRMTATETVGGVLPKLMDRKPP